jgi:hypothetical protein
MMGALKVRIGEVTTENGIVEYKILAEDNVRARDLLVSHLSGQTKWTSIRIRDTPETMAGPARVISKN